MSYSKTKLTKQKRKPKRKLKTFFKFRSIFHPSVLQPAGEEKKKTNNYQMDLGSATTWLFANLQGNYKSFWDSFRKIRRSLLTGKDVILFIKKT